MNYVQAEQYASFIKNSSLAISYKFDSTEFRLWNAEDKIITDEIMVTSLLLVHSDGRELQMAPKLKRMNSKCHAGILAAIDLPSLKLELIAADPSDAHLLFITCDNAAPNRSALRHIVAYFSNMPNVFIGMMICFAHILSLSAKYGSLLFPVGDIRRVTHYLRCRPLKQFDVFAPYAFGEEEIYPSDCFLGSSELVW